MFKNFFDNAKLVVVSGPVVAGTSIITPSAAVDTAGFQGVFFIASFGALSAGALTTLKAQGSSDNGNTDAFADLLGSHFNIPQASGSNQAAWLDIYRPGNANRYVLPIITRSTGNAVLNNLLAILYGPLVVPTIHDITTIAGGTFVPDGAGRGTA